MRVAAPIAACAIGMAITYGIACATPTSAVVAPSVGALVCIVTTVAADVAAHDPWSVCVADAVAKCGVDATTVATVWAAHSAAEVTEGFVPRMPVPTVDGGIGR